MSTDLPTTLKPKRASNINRKSLPVGGLNALRNALNSTTTTTQLIPKSVARYNDTINSADEQSNTRSLTIAVTDSSNTESAPKSLTTPTPQSSINTLSSMSPSNTVTVPGTTSHRRRTSSRATELGQNLFDQLNGVQLNSIATTANNTAQSYRSITASAEKRKTNPNSSVALTNELNEWIDYAHPDGKLCIETFSKLTASNTSYNQFNTANIQTLSKCGIIYQLTDQQIISNKNELVNYTLVVLHGTVQASKQKYMAGSVIDPLLLFPLPSTQPYKRSVQLQSIEPNTVILQLSIDMLSIMQLCDTQLYNKLCSLFISSHTLQQKHDNNTSVSAAVDDTAPLDPILLTTPKPYMTYVKRVLSDELIIQSSTSKGTNSTKQVYIIDALKNRLSTTEQQLNSLLLQYNELKQDYKSQKYNLQQNTKELRERDRVINELKLIITQHESCIQSHILSSAELQHKCTELSDEYVQYKQQHSQSHDEWNNKLQSMEKSNRTTEHQRHIDLIQQLEQSRHERSLIESDLLSVQSENTELKNKLVLYDELKIRLISTEQQCSSLHTYKLNIQEHMNTLELKQVRLRGNLAKHITQQAIASSKLKCMATVLKHFSVGVFVKNYKLRRCIQPLVNKLIELNQHLTLFQTRTTDEILINNNNNKNEDNTSTGNVTTSNTAATECKATSAASTTTPHHRHLSMISIDSLPVSSPTSIQLGEQQQQFVAAHESNDTVKLDKLTKSMKSKLMKTDYLPVLVEKMSDNISILHELMYSVQQQASKWKITADSFFVRNIDLTNVCVRHEFNINELQSHINELHDTIHTLTQQKSDVTAEIDVMKQSIRLNNKRNKLITHQQLVDTRNEVNELNARAKDLRLQIRELEHKYRQSVVHSNNLTVQHSNINTPISLHRQLTERNNTQRIHSSDESIHDSHDESQSNVPSPRPHTTNNENQYKSTDHSKSAGVQRKKMNELTAMFNGLKLPLVNDKSNQQQHNKYKHTQQYVRKPYSTDGLDSGRHKQTALDDITSIYNGR